MSIYVAICCSWCAPDLKTKTILYLTTTQSDICVTHFYIVIRGDIRTPAE